jgi:hypothetical protein
MVGGDGIPALGGTADRRPAVDPTALPIGLLSVFQDSPIPLFLLVSFACIPTPMAGLIALLHKC